MNKIFKAKLSVKYKLYIILVVLLFFIGGCADNKELIINNDPDKYLLHEDVVWASPKGIDLTLDIYTPKSRNKKNPVLIIFHGGGWLINDHSIMDQMSQYLATNTEYVICNVNYRLLSDLDNTVTLNEIVEDAFGAVLWVKENISQYKGDATKIAITGDSAGAHLSSMILNSGKALSANSKYAESLKFNPTYLPENKTVEEILKEDGLEVQAAILSYGAFDIVKASLTGLESSKNLFWMFSGSKARGVFGNQYNPELNLNMYQAVSPMHNIPNKKDRTLPPQFFTVGTKDVLTTPASVKEYTVALKALGHEVEYWEYRDQKHAFLDSGSNFFLGSSFEKDAPKALKKMIAFLDSIFKE